MDNFSIMDVHHLVTAFLGPKTKVKILKMHKVGFIEKPTYLLYNVSPDKHACTGHRVNLMVHRSIEIGQMVAAKNL
jgi:hypothetical protein